MYAEHMTAEEKLARTKEIFVVKYAATEKPYRYIAKALAATPLSQFFKPSERIFKCFLRLGKTEANQAGV